MDNCPLCEIMSKQETSTANADSLAVFGIVLRDIIPIERLLHIICSKHKDLLTVYYESIVEMYKKDYHSSDPMELSIPKKAEPDRNSN